MADGPSSRGSAAYPRGAIKSIRVKDFMVRATAVLFCVPRDRHCVKQGAELPAALGTRQKPVSVLWACTAWRCVLKEQQNTTQQPCTRRLLPRQTIELVFGQFVPATLLRYSTDSTAHHTHH
jgi:hypothetical protein